MDDESMPRIAVGLASRQRGLATRQQLVARRVPPSTIGSAVGRGFLIPVFTGVYLVGRPQLSVDGLLMACLLSAGDGAVLGARSAAAIWGFLDHRNPVHVLGNRRGRNQRAQLKVEGESWWPYLMIHQTRDLPPADVASVRGLPVTTTERSLRDCASALTEKRFRWAFMEADRLGLLDDDELQRIARRSQGRAKGRLFREMVERRIPGIDEARSLLEGIVLEMVANGLIPPPEVNRMNDGYRPDFRWRSSGVLVEADGYEFHRGREAFENDRLRSNRLKAAGWTVLPFTWRQVTETPDEVVSMIRGAIREGEGLRGDTVNGDRHAIEAGETRRPAQG